MRERLGLYFLMAVLTPLALGTLVSERLVERHIRGLMRGAVSERLDMVLARLDDQGRFLRDELMQVEAAAELVGMTGARDPGSVSAFLRTQSLGRKLDFLWLVSPDGKLLGRTAQGRTSAASAETVADLPILPRVLRGEEVVSYEQVAPALLRRRDGGSLLAHMAGVPVRDPDKNGAIVGALLSGVVLSGNDTLCSELIDHGSSNVAIAKDGTWVAGSPVGYREEGGAALRPSGPEKVSVEQLQAIAGGKRWLGATDPGGFAAMAPLANARGEGIGAVLVRTSTARFANLRTDARWSFIMAMGAGAMISLLLALLAARQITGPLRRLAQAANEMEKGRLDVPIVVEGNDEVAQLAVALKRTAGALSESMGTLESRVRERTAELEQGRDREAALNRDLKQHNERLQLQGEQLRAQGEVLEQQRHELEEKTRRSEEADRLKNAFIANMSHEIRTPLNSVLALSQLLRDGMAGGLTIDQRKYLEVIERNGQNLLRLINDILDLSRIEAGHLEMDVRSVDPAPLIRSAVAALAPLAEAKGLDLQVKLPESLPLVRCDEDRVQQVLTNLVGNAIKFTEVGRVIVSAEAQNGAVAIAVTDTGVGIPEALTAKIFQEFFQVDSTLARRQGGSGLGLAIASRLAHLMGGDITVRSVVGSGSRFTLTLPRGGAAEERPLSDVLGDTSAPLEGTVLLADDDAHDRRAAAQLLESAGATVVEAASGEEAMRLLGDRRFDAVVLDLFMPGLNGFDVLGEIRHDPHLAQLPFIVLTAHDLTADDREVLEAPVQGVLRKGDSMRAGLVTAVRKALKTRAGRGSEAPAAPPRSASILLVEDNEDNLFTLRQILGGLNVELATAGSGREAIEYCRHRRPDLIIMDVQMPGMSGLQATGAIRALPGGATIPIVALTAQAMKGDRERILAAGCDEYLAKPIQPKVLRAVVERLLGSGAEEMVTDRSGEKGQHGTHTPRR